MAATKRKYLNQTERNLCKEITALNITLVSRRAQALLLLDDGYTQAKSAELSSLTVGQLRYLLRLFKKKGIRLFPEEIFAKTEEKKIEETSASDPEVFNKDVKKKKKPSTKKKKQGKKEGKKKNSQSKKKKKKKGKKKKK